MPGAGGAGCGAPARRRRAAAPPGRAASPPAASHRSTLTVTPADGQEGRAGQHRDRRQGQRRQGHRRSRLTRRRAARPSRARCGRTARPGCRASPSRTARGTTATVTAADAAGADQDGDHLVHHDGQAGRRDRYGALPVRRPDVRRGDAGGGRVRPGHPKKDRAACRSGCSSRPTRRSRAPGTGSRAAPRPTTGRRSTGSPAPSSPCGSRSAGCRPGRPVRRHGPLARPPRSAAASS